MKKIRIKDIASIANVSIGTVDRVIHHRGEVSNATRDRIQKILEEYNYEPDLIASSLALKKQVTLAVVMPASVNGHEFWDLPRIGVQKAASELASGKLLLEHFSFDQISRRDFRKFVREFPYEKTRGVLFAPVFQDESAAFIERCRKEDVRVVLINSQMDEAGVSSFVGQDAFQSGKVAARLINYGLEHHRDVAIINMSARKDHYAHIIRREKGFRDYFEKHHDKVDNLVTVDLNGVEDRVLHVKLNTLFEDHRIGGLFVTNSRVYKVAAFLADRGAMGVRLVGYDLLPQSIEYLRREYIDFLISQNPEEQAYTGMLSLFNLVAFGREPPESTTMPIDIITRENLVYYKPKYTHSYEKPSIGRSER